MKYNLKYLFKAYYTDGTTYEQNQEDVSVVNPDASCFADVESNKLERFRLTYEGGFFEIDLTTGIFHTNAGQFTLHHGQLRDIHLVYFRRIRTTIVEGSDLSTPTILYFLGFSATVEDGSRRIHHITIS